MNIYCKFVFQKPIALVIVMSILFILPHDMNSQSHEFQIRAARMSSNAALKTLDMEDDLKILTEDVLITTGAGTLLSGKQALRAYIENANSAQPMFWVRSTEEIIVNEKRGLAWETGEWHGFYMEDQEEINPVVNGKYSAMWTHDSGEWKIKSQLFVTLD